MLMNIALGLLAAHSAAAARFAMYIDEYVDYEEGWITASV
jgi:hypothetical protein